MFHLLDFIFLTFQAITALKKGAYLLKYGRRGKPKFCPFRLSNVSAFLASPFDAKFEKSSKFLLSYFYRMSRC